MKILSACVQFMLLCLLAWFIWLQGSVLGLTIETSMFVRFYHDNAVLSKSLNDSLQKICIKLKDLELESCKMAHVLVYKPRIRPPLHVPFVIAKIGQRPQHIIFFPETQITNFESDLESILAHELGHLLGFDSELEADKFSATLFGPEAGIKALERATIVFGVYVAKKPLNERILALKSMRPLS